MGLNTGLWVQDGHCQWVRRQLSGASRDCRIARPISAAAANPLPNARKYGEIRTAQDFLFFGDVFSFLLFIPPFFVLVFSLFYFFSLSLSFVDDERY